MNRDGMTRKDEILKKNIALRGNHMCVKRKCYLTNLGRTSDIKGWGDMRRTYIEDRNV